MTTAKAGDPADFVVKATPPNASIRVGPHTIIIERDVFEAWENALSAAVGFSKPAMSAEIRRRLGL